MAKRNVVYDLGTVLNSITDEGEVFALDATEAGILYANPDAKDTEHPIVRQYVAGTKGTKAETTKTSVQLKNLVDANKTLKDAERTKLHVAILKAKVGEVTDLFGYSFRKEEDTSYTILSRPNAKEAGTERKEKLTISQFMSFVQKEENEANKKPRSPEASA